MEIEKDENVIESIATLLDNDQRKTYREFNQLLSEKKQLLVNLVDNNEIEEIKDIIDTLVTVDAPTVRLLRNMEELDIIGFWFIALKRCFTPELFRLSEMNIFLEGYRMMVKANDNGWLEQVLASVYHDLLAVEIDPTIFYTKSFIDNHFKSFPREITVDSYFSSFVFGEDPTQPILFSHFLDPVKDAEFLDDMASRSLANYYENVNEGTPRYECMTTRNEAMYTVGQARKRERLLRNMMATFSHVRQVYIKSATDTVIDNHADEVKHIQELFGDIIAGYRVNDFIKMTEREKVPHIIYKDVDDMMNVKYKLHPNDNASYRTLFEDNLYDSLLKINREKYQWVLPFNESEFSKRKMEETPLTTVRRQISDILIQENILWINMLTFAIHVEKEKKRVTKKRKSDIEVEEEESSSNDSSTSQQSKKKKVFQATLTAAAHDLSILSIIKGMGHLLIYNDSDEEDFSESTEFTYPIKAGDNIRIPDGTRYKIRYMDEFGNYVYENDVDEDEEEY